MKIQCKNSRVGCTIYSGSRKVPKLSSNHHHIPLVYHILFVIYLYHIELCLSIPKTILFSKILRFYINIIKLKRNGKKCKRNWRNTLIFTTNYTSFNKNLDFFNMYFPGLSALFRIIYKNFIYGFINTMNKKSKQMRGNIKADKTEKMRSPSSFLFYYFSGTSSSMSAILSRPDSS